MLSRFGVLSGLAFTLLTPITLADDSPAPNIPCVEVVEVDRRTAVDLFVRMTRSGVVDDPYLRNSDLINRAAVEVRRVGDAHSRFISLPDFEPEAGTPVSESVYVPEGGIIGARFWLRRDVVDPDGDEFQIRVHRQDPDSKLRRRSAWTTLGRCRDLNSIFLSRRRRPPKTSLQLIDTAIAVKTDIPAVFDVRFVNVAEWPVEVIDPFLQRQSWIRFPGMLKVFRQSAGGPIESTVLPFTLRTLVPEPRKRNVFQMPVNAICGKSLFCRLPAGKYNLEYELTQDFLLDGRRIDPHSGKIGPSKSGHVIIDWLSDKFEVPGN